jgi:dihydrolipoamide dehydrogenase
LIEVRVPDIGDFSDVPVVEILVAPGQQVAAEDPLVTLESDKATMDIPAPAAGIVCELAVQLGSTVSQGSLVLTLAPPDGAASTEADGAAPAAAAPSQPSPGAEGADRVDVVVLGSGPGGYTAAFRAADLGLSVVLVERYPSLGGVCLNVGCIPSKALLHAAELLTGAREASAIGITFGEPTIDLDRMRGWKDSVVGKLTGGLEGLAKQRKVRVVHGQGRFASPHELQVDQERIAFGHCIIAAGSAAAQLPGIPYHDERVIDSTGALQLGDIPERLLVIGGGIIGLEMACVYDALGAQVTVVELMDQLIPGCDPDLVRPLAKRVGGRYQAIHLGTRVQGVRAAQDGLHVTFAGDLPAARFDRVLVAVGRQPNGAQIGAEHAGVQVDRRGYIAVDAQQRTNVAHIFAIGDIAGEPMLAHKASHQGKVAAEVIAGHQVAFDSRAIPSVAYTDPEIAWAGLTETQARAQGIEYQSASFPWAASGRALSRARSDGLTKLLVDPSAPRRVLGAGIVGVGAGELIAEAVHAIEMGADAEDLALTIHPHPTLSETIGFAAESAQGTITDLYLPSSRRSRGAR